jgi:hypothetical protein
MKTRRIGLTCSKKYSGRTEQLLRNQLNNPYSLVYGMEAVTPLELVTPSFRIDSYDEERNGEAIATDLELVSKIRERAQVRIMEYQKRFKKAFDKTIAPTHFQQGDMILHKVEAT